MKTYIDQLQREIKLNQTPKRIVSLVPSQTEMLHDLGLENSIVGITKFCIHPKHYKNTKQIVGGTKQVHYDKIRALKPDVILCNKEENTKEMVVELERIAPVHVSDIFTIADALELFEQYGKLFDIEETAMKLQRQLKEKQSDFEVLVKDISRKRVAYFIWRNPWMVAGGNNIINHLLEINSFENVFKTKSRYPEVSLDELSIQNPEFVLLSSEPYPFQEKHIQEMQAILPNAKIILVDGEMFSWYGTHLLKAFNYFQKLHKIIGK